MKRFAPALALISAAAFAGTANAGGGYDFNSHYYGPSTSSAVTTSVAGSYVTLSANSYQSPSVQWDTVYVSPRYTSSNYYTAPAPVTVAPATYGYSTSYSTVPSYAATLSYSYAPSYTYPPVSYTSPVTTYQQPVTYTRPVATYLPTRHDATAKIRSRLDRQRSRIKSAKSRGQLADRELNRLRDEMRELRTTFRAFRDNDGRISRGEERLLTDKLDRQSRRIKKLANNGRTASNTGHGHAPYNGHHYNPVRY